MVFKTYFLFCSFFFALHSDGGQPWSLWRWYNFTTDVETGHDMADTA